MRKTKRIISLVVSVLLMFTFTFIIPLNANAVKKISLNKKNVNIRVGGISRLKVNNTSKKVTWKSSKKSVAKVNKNGVVRGVKTGKAVVTATVGKKIYKCKVVVKDHPEFVVDDLKLGIGGKEILYVKGTGKKITWSSSDDNIVKVDKIDSKTAEVTGVGNGYAIIVATVGKKELRCTVLVTETVKVEKTDLLIGNAGVRKMEYLSDNVTVTCSDESVVSVSVEDTTSVELNYDRAANIFVYGLKDGTADITIKNSLNDEVATFKVIVTKPKENTAKQKIVDFILNKGKSGGYSMVAYSLDFDWSGFKSYVKTSDYGHINSRIFYDPYKDDIGFSYTSTHTFSEMAWIMTPVEGTEGVYDVLFIEEPIHIPGGSPGEITGRKYRAVLEQKNFEGKNLMFQSYYDSDVVDEVNQKDANEFSQIAFERISSIIEGEMGVKMSELGFEKLS